MMRWARFVAGCAVASNIACGINEPRQRVAFGVMMPLQGALGYNTADVENGLSAGAHFINSNGGLLGEQITYILLDAGIPQTGFAQATAAAQQLIDVEHVPAVIGFNLDPELTAYLTSRNTPVLLPFDNTPLPQGATQLWHTSVNSKALGKATALDMNALGWSKVGYFHGTPGYAPATPCFEPYLQVLNPNSTWIDGVYVAPADSSNWDARGIVASVLAHGPDAVLIGSDTLQESFDIVRALQASQFPDEKIYMMDRQDFTQDAWQDKTLAHERIVLSGFESVTPKASNDALRVYNTWPGAYTAVANMYAGLDMISWISLAIAAAQSWDPSVVQNHMIDVVRGPLLDGQGKPTATEITDGQLPKGFELLQQGKPVWWQQESWDPLQLMEPGTEPSASVIILTKAQGTVASYSPQDYNLPQFPD